MPQFLLGTNETVFIGGTNGALIQQSLIQRPSSPIRGPIVSLTHPDYNKALWDWEKWRLVYEGGEDFVEQYTKRFSKRETIGDFRRRKEVTPTPVFAKASINEIKNSIFERMSDITRKGGPNSYHQACAGNFGGVDLRGSTMNRFIGHSILPEMLVMRKVGVYIDNPDIGLTLADKGNKHPFVYCYRAEDIRTWSTPTLIPTQVGSNIFYRQEFQAVLLRDWVFKFDPTTGLPVRMVENFRHVYIAEDGFVKIQMYDEFGQKSQFFDLAIKRVPFVIFELTDSLLKDVANHQIALLNLESSDISYILRGNYPIYTEQRDNVNTAAIKAAQQAYRTNRQLPNNFSQGTAPQSTLPDPELCQTEYASDKDIDVGVTEGRTYGRGMERPGFINPSPEPVKASMLKQDSLKEDIRTLVHLALSTVQSKMASAESKGLDRKGLESGLSNIGLELENGERHIASLWAMYEGSKEEPQCNYPEDYSLESIDDVIKQINNLKEIRDDLPSLSAKQQVNLEIARKMFASRVKPEVLNSIYDELKASKVPSSNRKIIANDLDYALLTMENASLAAGYPEGESTVAQQERIKRQAEIARSQGFNFGPNQPGMVTQPNNAQARGVTDAAPLPQDAPPNPEVTNRPPRGPNKL